MQQRSVNHASDTPRQCPGLTFGEELGRDSGWGRVFALTDDEPGTRSTARVIRLLADDQDRSLVAECGTPFQERLVKLLSLSLPHVALPVQFGSLSDGTDYLLEPRFSGSLAARIPASQGVGAAAGERWLRQILEGLAGLHVCELPYGDLTAEHVALDALGNAWIANAALGPLAWWSKGERLAPDSARYYPTEWQGRTGQPSAKADLYACGQLGCELFLGRDVFRDRRQGDSFDDSRMSRRLRQAGVARPLRRLLKGLRAPRDERPEDAGAALRLWRCFERQEARRGLMWWSTLMTLGFLVAATGLLLQHRQVVAQRAEIDGVSEKLARSENLLEVLRAGDQRRTDPIPQPPVSKSDPARRLWAETFRSFGPSWNPDSMTKALERASEPVRRQGFAWISQVRESSQKSDRWLPLDAALAARVQQQREAPWEPRHLSAAEDRLHVLDSAERLWRDWAAEDNRTWAEINELIDSGLARGAPEFQVLAAWREALVAHNTKDWTVRLKSGQAPEGSGLTRQVGVKDREGWHYAPLHVWKSPTSHTYEAAASSKMSLKWMPGDPCAICVYGDRSYLTGTRTLHLNTSIAGPLALWRMQDLGRIENDGFVLDIEIPECPGPPRQPSLLPKIPTITPRAATGATP